MAAQITAAIAHSTKIEGHGDGAPGRIGSCLPPAFPTTTSATIR